MEVIVDDTNILIDLANIGLIDRCKALDISFRTTDMAVFELKDNSQKESVEKYIEEGGLMVSKVEGTELMDVMVTYQRLSGSTNLTVADVSVMLLAERLGCRLLTNDQKLLKQAQGRGIEANGLLWLTDLMVELQIVSPIEMIDYLHSLLTTNERAPRLLIMQRIEQYTNIIKGK